MKKLIIAVFAAILLVPVFTSCEKTECKCYYVSYTTPEHQDAQGKMVGETDFVCYKWMSPDDISAYESELKSLGYTNVVVKSVADIDEDYRNKSMTDCLVPGEL